MKTGLIYMATSKTSGKSYIGQTMRFKKRKIEHKRDSFNVNSKEYNTHFHRAIRLYGFQDFTWKILADNILLEKLNLEEILAIYIYDTFYEGYNMTIGGDRGPSMVGNKNPMFGKTHTLEAKKKISDAITGNIPWMKGKKHSKEYKENMSKNRKGKTYRAKMWKIIKPNGEIEIIKNLKQYCRNNNLNNNCMSAIARKEKYKKSHKNYKCEMIGD